MNYRFSLPVLRRALSDGRSFAISSKASRAAILAITALGGMALPAQAQVFWPNEADYGSDRLYEPMPPLERRPHRTRRARHPKIAETIKTIGKPQGPIVIAISIEKQHLKVYDANGLFAESPVSTGMRGHATPMGVFSVIQKNKWHRSNIYSGAPMPYMQRITWSGIAMHAGVLPGYPASHGCIRMPTNFAVRMWGWTKMGARVVITPGDVTPVDFAHPRLMTQKPAPVAAAPSIQPDVKTTPKAEQAEIIKIGADASSASAALEKLDLRLTSIVDKRETVETADAGGALPQKTLDAAAKPDNDKAMAPSSVSIAKPDSEKSEAAKSDNASPPVAKRTGHLAAFISRKTGKLYVRQNFEPLFEVPVTIADSDRPLGTHVFTMRTDKENAGSYRWSVVSLPTPARIERKSHRKTEAEVAAPQSAPSSPGEALDRVAIPDDAMARISEAITPGGSLIVSDQGLGDETGQGTDFIVPLR